MTVIDNPTVTRNRYPYSFVCDRDCYTRLGCRTKEEAQAWEKEHVCQPLSRGWIMKNFTDKWGRSYTAPAYKPSLLEKVWMELDRTIDQIREANPHEADTVAYDEYELQNQISQGEARGLAYAILQYHWIKPRYESVQDVLRMSMKRWRFRHEDSEPPNTPGFDYNPAPEGSEAWLHYQSQEGKTWFDPQRAHEAPQAQRRHSTGGTATRRVAAKAPAKSKSKDIDPKMVPGMVKAINSGAFTVEAYAEAFEVSEDAIRAHL